MTSLAMQRDVQAQLAVLGDRLYKTIRAEEVMPGDSPAKRPDLAHWRTVLVRLSAGVIVPCCPLSQAILVPLVHHPAPDSLCASGRYIIQAVSSTCRSSFRFEVCEADSKKR